MIFYQLVFISQFKEDGKETEELDYDFFVAFL